jgi:hypothetical protein
MISLRVYTLAVTGAGLAFAGYALLKRKPKSGGYGSTPLAVLLTAR